MDESVEDAARRETIEEAGIRGVLSGPLLGEFPFTSGKAKGPPGTPPAQLVAFVFAMEVGNSFVDWRSTAVV